MMEMRNNGKGTATFRMALTTKVRGVERDGRCGLEVLVGADSQRIAEAMRGFRPKAARPNLFGDGHAAEKIAALLS